MKMSAVNCSLHTLGWATMPMYSHKVWMFWTPSHASLDGSIYRWDRWLECRLVLNLVPFLSCRSLSSIGVNLGVIIICPDGSMVNDSKVNWQCNNGLTSSMEYLIKYRGALCAWIWLWNHTSTVIYKMWLCLIRKVGFLIGVSAAEWHGHL